MDAPRCGFCGERHWLREGHRWKAGDVFMANDMANTVIDGGVLETAPLKSLGKCSDLRGLDKDGVGSTYRYRDTEKRRAYQREYMRKRRAEKRT